MEHIDVEPPSGRSPTIRKRRLQRIARALEAAARGESPLRLAVPGKGPAARIARAVNALVDRQEQLFQTIARAAGEGNLGAAAGGGAAPVRGDFAQAMALVHKLAWQREEASAVFSALDRGDLSRSMTLEGPDGGPLRDEPLRTARTINSLVRRLAAIRSEVIRIAEEVGSAGRLGGRAEVEGASGAWKELVDGVNLLASNLTSQVRNIALVTSAVARGDLSRKITVPANGEILELKETINDMVGQLRAFSAEVTRVARGGKRRQARRPGPRTGCLRNLGRPDR